MRQPESINYTKRRVAKDFSFSIKSSAEHRGTGTLPYATALTQKVLHGAQNLFLLDSHDVLFVAGFHSWWGRLLLRCAFSMHQHLGGAVGRPVPEKERQDGGAWKRDQGVVCRIPQEKGVTGSVRESCLMPQLPRPVVELRQVTVRLAPAREVAPFRGVRPPEVVLVAPGNAHRDGVGLVVVYILFGVDFFWGFPGVPVEPHRAVFTFVDKTAIHDRYVAVAAPLHEVVAVELTTGGDGLSDRAGRRPNRLHIRVASKVAGSLAESGVHCGPNGVQGMADWKADLRRCWQGSRRRLPLQRRGLIGGGPLDLENARVVKGGHAANFSGSEGRSSAWGGGKPA